MVSYNQGSFKQAQFPQSSEGQRLTEKVHTYMHTYIHMYDCTLHMYICTRVSVFSNSIHMLTLFVHMSILCVVRVVNVHMISATYYLSL